MLKPVHSEVSEIAIKYLRRQPAKERLLISTSADAHAVLLRGFDLDTLELQEQFVVGFLNRSNRLLGIYRCSIGGVTGTVADPRLILATALKLASVGILLSHNHPSGSLRPSRQDQELTTKIKEGARFMDIKVLDHIIVSPCREQYFSFADEGLL